MDRFIFDLQMFDDLGMNMTSGTKNAPNEITGYSGSDKLINLMADYVSIDVDGGNDEITASSSKHVTINAGAGDDTITAAAMEDMIIDGGDDKDAIKVTGSTEATIDGGAGDDTISILNSKEVVINAGNGADDISIGEGSSDVKITLGDGADTIRLSTDSRNVTITDSLTAGDVIVLSDLETAPRFATFVDGVLNLDGVKITVGSGISYDTDSTVSVTFGTGEAGSETLGELLKRQPPVWEVGLNPGKTAYTGTMTYYSNASEHKALATVSGLDKKKVEAVAQLAKDDKKKYVSQQFEDFSGITVDVNNNIILSKSLLPASGTVTLSSKDYKLALAEDEVEFNSEGTVSKKAMGFSVAGAATAVKTATFLTSAKSNGWYVGDDGKKLKFLKANAVSTTFSVSNLLSTTSTIAGAAESTITGLSYDISGNTGTVTISKADIFAEVAASKAISIAHRKAIIDGEDVQFYFTDEVDVLEVVGGKNDENIISSGTSVTLSTAAGNDWVTDYGKQNKIDLGDGNDYFFGEYNSDTVLAGKGDDYLSVKGTYNTINAGAGNDIIDIADGTDNTINADAGDDLISVNSDTSVITETYVLAGAGNDTVSIVGKVTEEVSKTYNFNGNTIDLGAGNDYAYVENVSDTAIVAFDGVNTVNLKAIDSGFVELGITRTYKKDGTLDKTTYSTKSNNTVNIADATDTTIITAAGKDSVKISNVEKGVFELGANADEVLISDTSVTGLTINMGAGADSISIIGGEVSEADGGDKNIFNTGADNDYILVSDTGITGSTINASFGNDTISLVSGTADPDDETSAKGNVIYYNYGGGNDVIYGFTDSDTLVIGGSKDNITVGTEITTVKIGKAATDTVMGYVVNVGKGKTAGTITLVNSSCDTDTLITNVTSGAAMESQIVWNVSNGTATGKLNGTEVAKITGLKVATGTTAEKNVTNAAIAAALSDNGDVITIGAEALNSTVKAAVLTGGTGYTLALGENVNVSSDTTTAFTFNTDSDTGLGVADFGKVTTEIGYKLSDDKMSVSYIKEPETHDGPVISGLNKDATEVTSDCFVLDGSTVYLSNKVLPVIAETDDDDSTSDTGITISGDYKLGLNTAETAVGGKVTVSAVTPAGWKFDVEEIDTDTNTADITKAAQLRTANIPQGYYINDKGGVGYNEASDPKNLVTIHGLTFKTQSKDLVVSDEPDTDGKYTITVSKDALNVVKTTVEGSSIYLEDTEGDQNSYKLVLGSGITKATLTAEGWKASGTTAYYQNRKVKSKGYAVSEDGLSIDYYTDDDGDNTIVTLTGLKSGTGTSANLGWSKVTDDTTNITTTTITVNKAALNKTDIELEVSENYVDANSVYELALGNDISSSTKVSDAAWNTVSGGKSLNFVSAKYSEGYAFANTSDDEENPIYDKTHIFYTAAHGGKTDINITGLTGATANVSDFVKFKDNASDTVVLTASKFANATNGATVTAYNDVYVVDPDSGEFTKKAYGFELSDAGKLTNSGSRGVSLIGSTGADILVGGAGKDSLFGGEGDDNLNGGASNDYLDGGKDKDILAGGNGNDTLHSGEGTGDSLHGGNGNDILFAEGTLTTLTGGAGNDIFVHTSGATSTTITDYAAGADRIYVSATSLTGTEVKIDGNKAIFTLAGDGGTITVNNGKNKVITLADSEGNVLKKQKYTANVTLENVAELWFDDDDEFATGETLADILNSEVVGEVETVQKEKVTQEKLVVYAKK